MSAGKKNIEKIRYAKNLRYFCVSSKYAEHTRKFFKGALRIQAKKIMLTLSMRLETLGECVISKIVNISENLYIIYLFVVTISGPSR
jgi:hypothetical protein